MKRISTNKPCADHEGNVYGSIKEMCKHWGIHPETFSRRIRVYNMSLKEALTNPVKANGGIMCYDHLGNEFFSIKEMCEYYKVERKLYTYRISHGWSTEDALTKKPRKTTPKRAWQ